MNSQSRQRMLMPPGPLTNSFLQLCHRTREFLGEQTQREMSRLPLAESLERTPGGELCVRKQLPLGLTILGTPSRRDPKIATLQIFFDPCRFKVWRESMGPLTLVYLNPYDIEVVLSPKTKRWGLFLDGNELSMNLETDDIYEVAKFEIQEIDVLRTA